MAVTPSTMLALGTTAPDFLLPNQNRSVGGKVVSFKDLHGSRAVLVMFICNHCPFVVHVRSELVRLANDYLAKEVAIVAISSNDVATHPADSPDRMSDEAAQFGYPFPYLYDESQAIAKAYCAACTPDFFLFDQTLQLVYRGQLDDSRPSNKVPVTGKDLRAALTAVLADKKPSAEQKSSIGCNIKWKAGNAPEYFG